MEDRQGRVRSLREIQRSVLNILWRLKDADAEGERAAVRDYVGLVDRFNDLMSEQPATQQYKAGREEDAEYFLRLLELAIKCEETGGDG